MKVTINIPEKVVKKAMLAVTIKIDEATDYMEDVFATESVEIDDIIEACSDICSEEELNTALLGFASLGIVQIVKNKVEQNEQVNTD